MGPIVTVENLCKTYKTKKGKLVKAVDDVSFNVNQGQILGILGNNGAGKTTTVKMICGLIRLDSGKITLNGYNISQRKNALQQISAVLEGNRNIYWRLTPYENMEYFAAINGQKVSKMKDRLDYLLEFFNLQEKRNEPVRSLSRGMQQKLAIAVCLAVDSPIIVLDEPTLGLDVQSSYEVRMLLKDIVRNEKKTILLTTHDMNVVEEVCEEVVIIHNGRIIAQNRIDSLMKLFQVQTYDFVLKNVVPEDVIERVKNICLCEHSVGEEQTKLTANLLGNDQFYAIIDILRNANIQLISLEKQNLNFEKVYLNIVRKEMAS